MRFDFTYTFDDNVRRVRVFLITYTTEYGLAVRTDQVVNVWILRMKILP
jgi:hypothetical protein